MLDGSPMLTEYDLVRYRRQIMLFGEEGQRRLKAARLFVGGAGGLGSPVCTYLAVAGVGHLRIVDFDQVELSNLNRQILHWDEDVGKLKVESARAKLTRINPSIEIEVSSQKIDESNVESLVGEADGIVDCMDNFPTRYLLNKTAIRRRIPFFHAAIHGFEARVITFVPGETACFRCLFHQGPAPERCLPRGGGGARSRGQHTGDGGDQALHWLREALEGPPAGLRWRGGDVPGVQAASRSRLP